MRPISDEQVIARIKTDNPWWDNGRVPSFYAEMRERPYLEQLYPLIADTSLRRAVVLMGPRRVGKTVMLYQAIARLLKNGVPSQKILYVSVDHPLYNNMGLDDFIEKFKTACRVDTATDSLYLFFDEIQYLKNWELYLKRIVDGSPNIKCAVSGSAAAALRLKSFESGAGRFTDFLLPPLTFYEYLSLRGEDDIVKVLGVTSNQYEISDKEVLNARFMDYLNYGGYPELALSATIRTDPPQFIKSDIIDKVLLRDLPSLYGIADIQELNHLFTALAYNTGNEVSLEELSKNSGVAKNTLKKYIQYLEAAFLIKTVQRVDRNAKGFQRATSFKVYLTNPSIRAALFAPITASDPAMGAVVETAVFAQLLHMRSGEMNQMCYARWNKSKSANGEIDIVCLSPATQSPAWIVEVKWTNRYFENPGELKGAIDFCHCHNIPKAIVTTIDINGNKTFQNIAFTYYMAAQYAFILGYKILRSKNKIEDEFQPPKATSTK